MTKVQRWLAARAINFGLWLLGFDYRHMDGLECLLGHVQEYRERLKRERPHS